ncbi:MAG: T9SS type A sorting domain-containing protein [Bacteroidales bacterium]|nr:T9SS type A sorting domain-containing protein [Bacteroidales bacterium]
MKTFRGIFMSALLVLISIVSFSQYVVTIGSNEQGYGLLPLDPYYNYSLSQQIYTEEELSVSSGDIVSVSFYYRNGSPTRNIDVYLQSTSLSQFEYPYNNVLVTSSDLVFSGTVDFVSGDWTTITFTQPFHYTGGNILLTVDDNTGSYVSSMQAAVFDAGITQTIAYHRDSEDYNPLDSIGSDYNETIKNTVKFVINNAEVLISNYPWTVDFEEDSFDFYSFTQENVSGNISWNIETSSENHFAVINNTDNSWPDTTILYTPTFVRPSNANTMILSFDYLNRIWASDYDKMQVVVSDGETVTVLAEYNEPHEELTHERITIDINDLPAEFKIGFVGIPGYGHGFQIDNITLEDFSIDNIVTSSYVQIGTGSSESSNLPIYPYYNYGYSQQIYMSYELDGSHTIYNISYYCTSTSAFARHVKIYMGHTSTSVFSTGNDWIPASQLTLVFDGLLEVSNMDNWLLIPLDTPFEYNGTDNLVLAVDDNSGEWYSTNTIFKCSDLNKNRTIYVYSDSEDYVIDDIESVSGEILTARNNVRFGIQVVEKSNIEVSSSDTLRGTACCSGEYYPGYSLTITATPKFGFEFDRWSDGVRDNPRFIVVEGDAEYVANFIPNLSDTVRYDNDTYNTPIGNHGNAAEWGIRILPQNLKDRPKLTDVLFYSDGQHACGNYKLSVYQGDDTIPSQTIYRDSVVVAAADEGHWVSFEISTVAIDSTQPLWIILSTDTVAYPAIASTALETGTDGRWWKGNGTWGHQSYGAWMIKAVLPYEGTEDVEEYVEFNDINVYPNPAGSHIYLTGISEGENVEIYNMTGKLVANFKYDGGAVDVANLTSGLYVVRSNGLTTKFVKE